MGADFESKFFRDAVPAAAAPLLVSLRDAAPSPVPALRRYELLERLGEGGMAVVYGAVDRDLNRRVAVKVLKESLLSSAALQERFRRETQIGAKLSHPNIVTLLDAGEEGGRSYLVLEWVRGDSLARILAGRRTETRVLVALLEKAARAVHHAHENGVIHRDLKPANILVTEGGEPKVADFGLARLLESGSDLTRSGAALGTPSYMAPEQVDGRGRDTTPRTDVYALGAVLYEILAGRPPHTGDSVMEILHQVQVEDPVPPRKIHPRTSVELETICLKALEKDPARRYASAAAFADDLRRHLQGEPVLAQRSGLVTRTVKWGRRHRAVSAALIVGAAGLLAVAGAVSLTIRRAGLQRRAEVDRLLREGHRSDAERRRVERELDDARELRSFAAASIDPMDDAAEKADLWKADDAVDALQVRLADLKASSITAFARAVGIDPACDEARNALALHYWNEFEKAEAESDLPAAAGAKQYVLLYDSAGAYRARFDAPGTIEVASDPPGAEVHFFRYVKGADRTLAATPCDPASGRLGPAPGLLTSDFNRMDGGAGRRWTLASGSYLALFRLPGFLPVRAPVLVRRGGASVLRVTLYRPGEAVGDFVLVPGGTFIRGGDPGAGACPPLDPAVFVGDFFMERRETRMNEYIEFLNDLLDRKGSDEVRRRQPRMSMKGETLLNLPATGEIPRIPPKTEPSPDLPVFGISWDDARAFAEWKTDREARNGVRCRYRLPTILEWEKAARGVDGRFYPWGNYFDRSHLRRDQNFSVDSKDESPCGVMDLAGSLREWCDDAYGDGGRLRHVRGGGILFGEGFFFRAANEQYADGRIAYGANGFRLVMIPERAR